MSTFRTCKNCVLEKLPCERRESLRSALTGLGVTSVKHLCSHRKPIFRVGQRVLTAWNVPGPDEEYGMPTEERWPATVIAEVGPRFVLKVDDVESDYETPATDYFKNPTLYVKARVGKIEALDEPAREVCGTCGRVGRGPLGEDGCYAVGSHYTPYGCLAAKPDPKIGQAATQ